MIIDVHSHDFPDAIATRAMAVMSKQAEWALRPVGDGRLASHIAHLALAGVDRAVSCPVATKPGMFEGIFRRAVAMREGELGEEVRRRIIPFASVHPLDPHGFEHLERVAAAGLKGIKLHCYYQDFSLADKELWPFFGKIADLGLVVQCHCGSDVSWAYLRGLCGPREITLLLRNVSGLKFIAAHLGGLCGESRKAAEELVETGCYIDTSVLHRRWHWDDARSVLRSWPRERILFGTDYPWVHYPEALKWVRSIRDRADWDLMLGDNARRLLGVW